MLRPILLVIALLLAPLAARAQEVLDPNPEIEATIGGQFEAFVARDIEGAFDFAAPSIQGLFRTPETFSAMVRNGYPMVWDPADIRFVDLQTLAGVIVQRVQVTDQDGRLHMLGYSMIETEAGWRINGVQILRAPGVGA